MAKIPIQSDPTHFYTIEARQQVGYDVKLNGNAVIIHEVDPARSNPAHVIDADLNGDNNDQGAMWTPGEIFNDFTNQLWVRVESATTTGFIITVSNQYHPFTATPTSTSTSTPTIFTRTPTPTPALPQRKNFIYLPFTSLPGN